MDLLVFLTFVEHARENYVQSPCNTILRSIIVYHLPKVDERENSVFYSFFLSTSVTLYKRINLT